MVFEIIISRYIGLVSQHIFTMLSYILYILCCHTYIFAVNFMCYVVSFIYLLYIMCSHLNTQSLAHTPIRVLNIICDCKYSSYVNIKKSV